MLCVRMRFFLTMWLALCLSITWDIPTWASSLERRGQGRDAAPDTVGYVASLSSTKTDTTLNARLPRYGTSLPGARLGGVYCVDRVNRMVYAGANIIHVFRIDSIDSGGSADDVLGLNNNNAHSSTDAQTQRNGFSTDEAIGRSALGKAFYSTQVGQIDVDGWATACLFANRYELFIAVVDSNAALKANRSGQESASHAHYTVIHRYLHVAIRTVPVWTPSIRAAFPCADSATPDDAVTARETVFIGKSVIVDIDPNAEVAFIATPQWNGVLSVHAISSVSTSTRSLRIPGLAHLLALVRINAHEGARSDKMPMVFIIGFVSSGPPNVTTGAPSEMCSAPLNSSAPWDIVGIPLSSLTSAGGGSRYLVNDVSEAVALGATERLGQCYRDAIRESCSDCTPVAVASSGVGLVVSFVSQEHGATYVAVLPIHTDCTLSRVDDSEFCRSPSSTESLWERTSVRNAAWAPLRSPVDHHRGLNTRLPDTGPVTPTEVLERRARTLLRSPAVQLTQLADTVCDVAGMVVGDDMPQRAYILIICPLFADGAEMVRTSLVQVRLEDDISSVGEPGVKAESIITVRQRYRSSTSSEASEEEVIALDVVNDTRLIHITLRRPDATITVETYTGFGLTAVKPFVVDATGGTEVQLSGYGLLPGLMCVFGGSADVVNVATIINSSVAICVAPAFFEVACRPYPVAVRMSYTAPWALPSASPLRAARSPFTVTLLQLPTPVVMNATATSTGGSHTSSGARERVILRGKQFVEPGIAVTAGLRPSCKFWSPLAIHKEISANASFFNGTAVACLFTSMPMLPPPSFISLSMDGTVFSTTAAPFSVLGKAVALGMRVLTENLTREEESHSVHRDSQSSREVLWQASSLIHGAATDVSKAAAPTVSSSTRSSLPTLEVFFIDSVGNRVSAVDSDGEELLAFVSIAEYATGTSLVDAALTVSSARVATVSLELEGKRLVAFDAEGVAVLSGLSLRCPPIGRVLLRVQVVQEAASNVSSLFAASDLWVNTVEGAPYRTAFVGKLSTTYYPDWPLLRHQPVIGVQDECLNTFRTLNDTVLPGVLTVQLYSERYHVLATGSIEKEGAVPYGRPWTVKRPQNNMFYLTNISLPAVSFRTWYYITISSDLPQPKLWSKAIEVLSCDTGYRSVLHTVEASAETVEKESAATQSIRCERCPPHGICNGTSTVAAEDGYWRLDARTTHFISCRSVYGSAEACVRDGQCADGYEGILCGTCASGYHKFGRSCRRCLPKNAQYLLLVLMSVVTVGVLTCMVVGLALIPPAPLLVVSTRNVVLTVQVLSLLSHVTLMWPSILDGLFNGLSAMSGLPQTFLSCNMSPQGILIFISCAPLVLIPLVAALSRLWLRLLKQHRLNAHSVCAIVLAALLHRKQECFHILRHTTARKMWESNTRRKTRTSPHSGLDALESHTSASPQTPYSLSSEWLARGGEAIHLNPLDSGSSSPIMQHPVTPSMQGVGGTSPDFSLRRDLPVSGRLTDPEGFVLDVFALRLKGELKTLVECHPGTSEELTILSAMEQGDEGLLEAVACMSAPLVAKAQVEEWTQHALDVEGFLSDHREAPNSFPMRRSGSQGFDAARSASSGPGSLPPQGMGADESPKRCASPIMWRRVGMISAYRAIAVHQFRASWTAVLLSTTCVTLMCLYSHLLIQALLWQRCISLGIGVRGAHVPKAIPSNGASLHCDSTAYFSMRGLGRCMLIIYGLGTPSALAAVAILLKRHYGKDVAHAALPLMVFDPTALDLIISVWHFAAELVGSVAVTQASAPMLQIGALVVVMGLSLIVYSAWCVRGRLSGVRIWVFSVPLHGIITASQVIVFVLGNLLLLFSYLTLSEWTLTVAMERAFVGLTVAGIAVVGAMLLAVTLHEALMNLWHMRESGAAAVRNTVADRQTLQSLVQRYRDTCHTIKLYFEGCQRGLLVAQKLDALSRGLLAVENASAAAAAMEHSISLSSRSRVSVSGTSTPTPSLRSIATTSPETLSHAERRQKRQHGPVKELSSDVGSVSDERFPSFPNLDSIEDSSRSTLAPLFSFDEAADVSRDQPTRRQVLSPVSAATCSNTADTEICSATAPNGGMESEIPRTQRSEPLHVHDEASHCVPLTAPNYPDGKELCVPTDDNDYWVPTRPSGAEGCRPAEEATATTTDNAPRHHPHSSAGVIVSLDILGSSNTTGVTTAPARKGDVVGALSEAAEPGKHAQVTASSSRITGAAPCLPEQLCTVALPKEQPTRRRSDSLLISIRSLESQYIAEAQAARVALERDTFAVAAATAGKGETLQRRQSNLSCVSESVGVGGINGAAGYIEGKVFAGPRGDIVGQRHQHLPDFMTTSLPIDYLAVSIHIDLASSFDPLTVPPLPPTGVLGHVHMTSSQQQRGGSRHRFCFGAASMLAELRQEMNLQLRQIEAVVAEDLVRGTHLRECFGADSFPEDITTLAGVLIGESGDGTRAPKPRAVMNSRSRDTDHATAGVVHSVSAEEALCVAGREASLEWDKGRRGDGGTTFLLGELSKQGAGDFPACAPPDSTQTSVASVLPLPIFVPVSKKPQTRNRVSRTHSPRRMQPTARHAPSPRSAQEKPLRPSNHTQLPPAPASVQTSKPSSSKNKRPR